MKFESEYKNIKNTVKEDFILLEKQINELFVDDNPLNSQLISFLTAPSKRIRPLLGFLFLRCVFENIDESQRNALLAIELIHNATLIHDDVIDNASKRRNQETINARFDNSLAVVAGDFLLSLALEKTISTKSIEVLELFTCALKAACVGETNQYFNKFKITSIEDYIEKSKDKTALLFQTGILAGILLAENKTDKKDFEDLKKTAAKFSEAFGIAFQIRDDLINITSTSDLKPCQNDFESGIYTAPVIFAAQENAAILEKNDFSKLKETKAIEKTKDLMDTYFNKSATAIKDLKNCKYKVAILKLIDLLKCSI